MSWIPVVGDVLGGIGSIIAGDRASDAAESASKLNYKMQHEFAKLGLRWRVEDAKAAGLHPMAALGASPASASPVGVFDDQGASTAESLGKMGQNISRSVHAALSTEEREINAIKIQSAKLDLEGKAIENQIKAKQLAGIGAGPAFPGSDNFIPGQGNSGLVREKPLERTVSAPGRPAQEAGWRPDVAYSRTDTGLTPVVPESLSESLEDDIIGKAMWRMRNQLIPNYSPGSGKPPLSMLPKGATDWRWSPSKQEWQPDYKKPSNARDYYNPSIHGPMYRPRGSKF